MQIYDDFLNNKNPKKQIVNTESIGTSTIENTRRLTTYACPLHQLGKTEPTR